MNFNSTIKKYADSRIRKLLQLFIFLKMQHTPSSLYILYILSSSRRFLFSVIGFYLSMGFGNIYRYQDV